MLQTKDTPLTIEDAKVIAGKYIVSVFDESYFIYSDKKVDGGYRFGVACTREDMTRDPAVGTVLVFNSGDIQTLSEDRVREMEEAAEVQAAQQRKELAKDQNGYVLRRHARIKASSWLSNYVDLKIGAEDGVFVQIESPIWRFTVYDFALESEDKPLGVIDVDALTGEVQKPDEEEIEIIVRIACASRKYTKYTTTACS